MFKALAVSVAIILAAGLFSPHRIEADDDRKVLIRNMLNDLGGLASQRKNNWKVLKCTQGGLKRVFVSDSLDEYVAEYRGCREYGYIRDSVSVGGWCDDQNIDRTTIDTTTLRLIKAAEKGHLTEVKSLLDAGANVNAVDEDGRTALMLAALFDHLDVVQVLLKAGANVNATNNRGITALMWGFHGGGGDKTDMMVQTLLDAGAKVNVVNKEGNTALMYATQAPPVVIKTLLKAGANVNATNNDGDTVLKKAVLYDGQAANVKQLLNARAKVNVADKHGATALMWSAWKNLSDVTQILLDAGANVNAVDEDGRTALMYGAWPDHLDVVQVLLKAGAKIDATDKDGDTALSWSLASGHDDVVLMLRRWK
ncbi:MAG: ankyrin repeat domain-containing protein [Syntrophobacterales bacterium]|nr:ankyrin repeat domain-containing protein [Syntrophobacterales bacterium]